MGLITPLSHRPHLGPQGPHCLSHRYHTAPIWAHRAHGAYHTAITPPPFGPTGPTLLITPLSHRPHLGPQGPHCLSHRYHTAPIWAHRAHIAYHTAITPPP